MCRLIEHYVHIRSTDQFKPVGCVENDRNEINSVGQLRTFKKLNIQQKSWCTSGTWLCDNSSDLTILSSNHTPDIPTSIKLMIYNSLILSRINYGILAWGYNSEGIFKLQKKAVRLITLAKFNAHCEPIFKSLNLLKVQDIFEICQMKFYHNYLNKNYLISSIKFHFKTTTRYTIMKQELLVK